MGLHFRLLNNPKSWSMRHQVPCIKNVIVSASEQPSPRLWVFLLANQRFRDSPYPLVLEVR
jgi:hypothetical protein